MFPKLHLPEMANKKKPSLVAELIIEAIREGKYEPNDKLPAERVLAEQIGVSRGVVREALSALQIAGVIQIRTGEGSFVTPPTFLEASAAQAFSILEENDSPLELWEARRELEITVVRLASSRAERGHIAAVEEVLDEMRRHVRCKDLDEYLKANARFHQTLMDPVDNPILLQITGNLIASTNQLLTRDPVYQYLSLYLKDSLQKHVRIFRAYVDGDPDAIRASITHHFRELEDFYLR